MGTWTKHSSFSQSLTVELAGFQSSAFAISFQFAQNPAQLLDDLTVTMQNVEVSNYAEVRSDVTTSTSLVACLTVAGA
jgi:hypothetical protein